MKTLTSRDGFWDTDWVRPGETTRFFYGPSDKDGNPKPREHANIITWGYIMAGYCFQASGLMVAVLGGEDPKMLETASFTWRHGADEKDLLPTVVAGGLRFRVKGPLTELESYGLEIKAPEDLPRQLAVTVLLEGELTGPRSG